tara:strand:+ start:223 stop:474 length:252 start_codon:yes stop_codon:yes gene_type:complete
MDSSSNNIKLPINYLHFHASSILRNTANGKTNQSACKHPYRFDLFPRLPIEMQVTCNYQSEKRSNKRKRRPIQFHKFKADFSI